MLNIILGIAATLLISHKDIDRLRRLEPSLSVRAASEHIELAQKAEAVTGVDRYMMLALAWHETRFSLNHRQREIDGRISCGVVTATPVATEAECQVWIEGGYIAAGRHLHDWFDARDRKTLQRLSRHDALIGVAGGYRLIELCRKGPVWIRPGVDTCRTPEVFDAIADRLREPRPALVRRQIARRPNS